MIKRRMEEVEVSINDNGLVCIAQPGLGDGDSVQIAPEQVDLLVEWLKEIKEEAIKQRK